MENNTNSNPIRKIPLEQPLSIFVPDESSGPHTVIEDAFIINPDVQLMEQQQTTTAETAATARLENAIFETQSSASSTMPDNVRQESSFLQQKERHDSSN